MGNESDSLSGSEGHGDCRLAVSLTSTGFSVRTVPKATGGVHRDTFLKDIRSLLDSAKADDTVQFEVDEETGSETILASSILAVIHMADKSGVRVNTDSIPEKIEPLIKLATAVPRRVDPDAVADNFVVHVGKQSLIAWKTTRRFIEFLGLLVFSFGKMVLGRSRFRKRDFWLILQDCGVGALPIVSLLAVLTGTILGFVGAVQLRKFGATIYMTDLVGLAMAREMAAIMTGIIMAGRTGAAFAAQIGSMNVNEEVDALETMGISAVEFLVLPRTLALILMMPLLTLYANVLGWTGGFIVALPMNINPAEYWNQLIDSLTLNHIVFGISKSFFFGIVVATTGCYYGLRSGRNSAAVGTATTRAVVAGITWIIILDAIFAFMDEILNY